MTIKVMMLFLFVCFNIERLHIFIYCLYRMHNRMYSNKSSNREVNVTESNGIVTVNSYYELGIAMNEH